MRGTDSVLYACYGLRLYVGDRGPSDREVVMEATERQLDVFDVLVDTAGETCPDCPDPASCQAQRECSVHTEELVTGIYSDAAWDPIP